MSSESYYSSSSSTSELGTMVGLLDEAFGDPEVNIVHFKKVETILYVLAKHLRLMDRQVNFVSEPFAIRESSSTSAASVTEVKIHAKVKKKGKDMEGKKEKEKEKGKDKGGKRKKSGGASKQDEDSDVGKRKKEKKTSKGTSSEEKKEKGKKTSTEEKKGKKGTLAINEVLASFEMDREKLLRVINQRSDSRVEPSKKPKSMEPMSDTEVVHEKLLVVEKFPKGKPQETGRGRDRKTPELGIVTMAQFAPLRDAVNKIQSSYKAALVDKPDSPVNEKLMDELGKGKSLSDAIAALQLSARVETAEKMIDNLTDVIKKLKQHIPGMDDKLAEIMRDGKASKKGRDDIDDDKRGYDDRDERAGDKSRDRKGGAEADRKADAKGRKYGDDDEKGGDGSRDRKGGPDKGDDRKGGAEADRKGGAGGRYDDEDGKGGDTSRERKGRSDKSDDRRGGAEADRKGGAGGRYDDENEREGDGTKKGGPDDRKGGTESGKKGDVKGGKYDDENERGGDGTKKGGPDDRKGGAESGKKGDVKGGKYTDETERGGDGTKKGGPDDRKGGAESGKKGDVKGGKYDDENERGGDGTKKGGPDDRKGGAESGKKGDVKGGKYDDETERGGDGTKKGGPDDRKGGAGKGGKTDDEDERGGDGTKKGRPDDRKGGTESGKKGGDKGGRYDEEDQDQEGKKSRVQTPQPSEKKAGMVTTKEAGAMLPIGEPHEEGKTAHGTQQAVKQTEPRQDIVTWDDYSTVVEKMKNDINNNVRIVTTKLLNNTNTSNRIITKIEPEINENLTKFKDISAIESQVTEYSRKINSIDKFLSGEMTAYQGALSQMEYDLEIGLEVFADALANQTTDPAAVADLLGKFEHAGEDLQNVAQAQFDLLTEQNITLGLLKDRLLELKSITTDKIDRDTVSDLLASKIGAEELNLYVDDQEFTAVVGDIQKRMRIAFNLFNNQEYSWQKDIDDIVRQCNGKADQSSLEELNIDIDNNLDMLRKRIEKLASILGEKPHGMTNKKLIRDGNCLSCGTPWDLKSVYEIPEDDDDIQSVELPPLPKKKRSKHESESEKLMKRKDEDKAKERPCYGGLPVLHPQDARAQFCRRYCGAKVPTAIVTPEIRQITKEPKVSEKPLRVRKKSGAILKYINKQKEPIERFPCLPCNRPKKKRKIAQDYDD